MNYKVVDLSHWDPASDYHQVKAAGILGVIYKATEGTGYQDPTYVSQRMKAMEAGLLWGAYHFGHRGSIDAQVANFVNFAKIHSDDLFCLDWEDSDSTMTVDDAREFIIKCEAALTRVQQCVVYSGNTVKDQLGNKKDLV